MTPFGSSCITYSNISIYLQHLQNLTKADNCNCVTGNCKVPDLQKYQLSKDDRYMVSWEILVSCELANIYRYQECKATRSLNPLSKLPKIDRSVKNQTNFQKDVIMLCKGTPT